MFKKTYFVIAATMISILFGNSSLFAQRDLKDIPVPDPELERKSFQVADGFEVNLYAADPQIAKPIQMNFDSEGRLWIAISEVYPQIKPGQKANDKILILEDTNQDGVADVTKVFVDGLLIPTGVEPGDGGVYVANSTELLHFKDTNGDGKSDVKKVVLSGFGTEDTHHILHTLRWGPEGFLYFNQSIYIHSHIETPYGVKRLNAGGIWQFRPDTLQLDVIMKGLVNPWGHHIDRWGQSFATDGAGGDGINYVLPGAYYVTAYKADRLLRGLNPGSPKHCGLEILSGQHLPEDWQGQMITNDFRGHRVCRFLVQESGAGYVSHEQQELIKTDHVAFRPIDVKMGPDGAIYIADWYNPIIQHGEVDFRDHRRDHTHGRIWRVTRKGKPTLKRPDLVNATDAELLQYLKAPEGWTRHHTKRVLSSRGKKTIPELDKFVKNLSTSSKEYEKHLLEALWSYQTLATPNIPLLKKLLNAKDGRARAAAVKVIPHWKNSLPDALELLAQRIQDPHPRVRLEAVRAITHFPGLKAMEIAIKATDLPVDHFMEYALWLTTKELKSYWLPELVKNPSLFDGKLDRQIFALKLVNKTEIVPVLVRILKKNQLNNSQSAQVLEMLSRLGNAAELGTVYQVLLKQPEDSGLTELILKGLAQAAQNRKVVPQADVKTISQFLQSKKLNIKSTSIQCIGLWKLTEFLPELKSLILSESVKEAIRTDAFLAVSRIGGAESQKLLTELLNGQHSKHLQVQAVESLVPINISLASKETIKLLQNTNTRKVDLKKLIQAFLKVKTGHMQLTKSLKNQKISEEAAKVVLQVISSSGQKYAVLTKAVTDAGQIKQGEMKLSAEEMAKMVADVKKHGDAAKGEQIYRRANLTCMKCHAIGGVGGRVGPDLSSLGGSAQIDYLVESILEPSKKIKENYHTVVVATADGKILSGVKLRQTDSALILRNADDKEISIPLDDIDDQTNGSSIMPTGLSSKMTRKELVDLVRFLSELGKSQSYSVGTAPVLRRWQVLNNTKEAAHAIRRTSFSTTVKDNPAFEWLPAYSTVSGQLPVAILPHMSLIRRRGRKKSGHSFVRTEISVSTGGECLLEINDVSGTLLWIDSEAVKISKQVKVNLKPGTHKLTFGIDRNLRKLPLRVSVQSSKGSSAQIKPVLGK